jgi:nicotinate-nucleotide adenylyltransferase
MATRDPTAPGGSAGWAGSGWRGRHGRCLTGRRHRGAARLAFARPGRQDVGDLPAPLAGLWHDRPVESAVRRIGVMGGTFDPVHHGHLIAASEVAVRFGLDEVVFVPTGLPWQKGVVKVSPAEDRYLMTVIATASNPRFTVSRVDIDRPGPTYTIDTLRDLRLVYDDAELYFITGADALEKILSWKDVDEMFELAHFVGVTRPGFELSDEHLPDDTVTLVTVPAMAISSTDCRTRVAAGQPVWYLVPDGVVQYIAKRRLYL